MPDHMELWNRVCETDREKTTSVNTRGGWTAINAQYQRRMATEQFGPYGWGWGLKDLKWELVRDADKSILELALHATFWYQFEESPDPNSRLLEAEFPISVDCRYSVNDDCRKKLITDATTKALSFLGFNADIFEGRWDDNRYVEKLNFRQVQKKKFEDIAHALRSCANEAQLERYIVAYQEQWKAEFSDRYQSKLEAVCQEMRTELQSQELFGGGEETEAEGEAGDSALPSELEGDQGGMSGGSGPVGQNDRAEPSGKASGN